MTDPASIAALLCAAFIAVSVVDSEIAVSMDRNDGGQVSALTSDSAGRVSGIVRVMTWNIRYDTPDDGAHAWAERRNELLSFVLSRKVDILCIQEALHHQATFFKERLQGVDMRGAGRDDGKEQGEYCAIYYDSGRFAAAADGTFWLSPTPAVPGRGWDAALPRIVTWVKLVGLSRADTLFVFNTHFDHQGEEAREKSARLLRTKVGEIAGEYPFVVGGDFNSAETDLPYGILTSPDLAPPRLEDAMYRSAVEPDGPKGTYTGFEPADPGSGTRVDYFFVSHSLQVLRHSTPLARTDRGFLSDHLPVIVDLKLPGHP